MMARRKVAVVITTLHIGGAQKVVIDIAKALDKSKFDLCIFVHDAPVENHFTEELRNNGISVKFIRRDAHVTWGSYRRLAAALSAFAPDVLHIHLDTVYAPLWALLHRCTVIFTIHSQAHRIFGGRAVRTLFRCLVKKKNFLLTGVSQQIAREAAQILGVPEEKVATLYNPVVVPEQPSRPVREPVKFVNVARFNPIKNHRLLLEAFCMACRNGAVAQLYLAGDGKEMENCQAYAQALGIADQVHFLGNVENPYELLRACDAFVLSSDSEALPISVLEAMACALPIIATNVGGVPELVKENGILVQKRNAEQLAAAILKLAGDPQLRQDYADASYRAVQPFCIETVAGKYAQLYTTGEQ